MTDKFTALPRDLMLATIAATEKAVGASVDPRVSRDLGAFNMTIGPTVDGRGTKVTSTTSDTFILATAVATDALRKWDGDSDETIQFQICPITGAKMPTFTFFKQLPHDDQGFAAGLEPYLDMEPSEGHNMLGKLRTTYENKAINQKPISRPGRLHGARAGTVLASIVQLQKYARQDVPTVYHYWVENPDDDPTRSGCVMIYRSVMVTKAGARVETQHILNGMRVDRVPAPQIEM